LDLFFFLFKVQLERVRDELTLQNFTLKSKLAELSARITDSTTYRLEKPNNSNNSRLNGSGGATTVILPSSHHHSASPSPTAGSTSSDEGVGGIHSTSTSSTAEELKLRRKSTYKVPHNNEANAELRQLRSLINDLHNKELEYQRRISQLETESRNMKNQLGEESTAKNEYDRVIRTLEDQLETTQRRLEEAEKCLLSKEEESSALKLDLDTLNDENRRLNEDLNILHLKVCSTSNSFVNLVLLAK
jgi:uncharacterized phage infection (PIP) family protein YhgE